MNKHIWRIIVGGLLVFTPFLIYRVIRLAVEAGDDIVHEIIFGPLGVKSIPVVGFLLLLGIMYAVGWAKETKAGVWLERIPWVGKLFVSPSKESQEVLSRIKGFIFGPIWNGYRPARFSAIFPLRRGGWWVQLTFVGFPLPITQGYPSEAIIYAIEKRNGAKRDFDAIPEELEEAFRRGRFTVFTTEVGLRVEFTAGTTVPIGALFDLAPIALGDFLRSQGF